MKRILFIGDSITDGNRGRDGDPNHELGHGYVFLIAAELGAASPEAGKRVWINRGVSGHRVADLYGRWEDDALLHEPDIISLLAGVNDVHAVVRNPRHASFHRFERTYRRIVEDTLELLPGVRFIVCEPFLLPAGWVRGEYAAWEPRMREAQRIVRRIADDYRLPFVPLQDAFDRACEQAPAPYWLWDGIHPTPAGHALIKERWLEVYRTIAL